MSESEQTSVGSDDENEEKSTSEGNEGETDEDEDASDSEALPKLNIKGPGKVNIKNSQGVKVGHTVNMTVNVGKVIVQNEANQQPVTASIQGTSNSLQEIVEDMVTKHLQNLLGDKVIKPLPIQSKTEVSSISELEESGMTYFIEEPSDENMVTQSVCHNNEVSISEEPDETALNIKDEVESSELIDNMSALELNRIDYHRSRLTTQAVQTEEIVENSGQTEPTVLNSGQTEETILNSVQTELFDRQLLLECFLKELVNCIQMNSLSEIELEECGKVYNDNVKDPFGYKVDVKCKDGRLLDFSTLYLKSMKQFEMTENSVIIQLDLSFSTLEFNFSEFTIIWNMNLPKANIFTIKGDAKVSVQTNSITIKLVFMYNDIDNSKPLIKLVEDVHLEKINVNINRYPDEIKHNRNDKVFLDYLKLYLSHEYLSNIKEYIRDTVSKAIDHLVTSDNTFRLAIIRILNYLDDHDFPFD